MKLKDLEKIKLLETAIMIGVPIGLFLTGNPVDRSPSMSLSEYTYSRLVAGNEIPLLLASAPRIADILLSTRLELHSEDYKKIEQLYNQIVSNTAKFFKEQNITDPIEIFTLFQYMYRNGYLSYDHQFNYDINMKDLSKLNGADVVRGRGVCRSISSFLTDLYKEMGYNSSNLIVNANKEVLSNIERLGNYPKFKISRNTTKFVKTISKVSEVFPMANHLITLIEKDGKVYILDPTNDGFLVKGKGNQLVLPENQKGRMRVKYLTNILQRMLGTVKNTKNSFEIKKMLSMQTIDYEEYRKTYIDTLIFIKQNVELLDQFYKSNQTLYEELFEIIEQCSPMITRIYPELKILTILKGENKNNHHK